MPPITAAGVAPAPSAAARPPLGTPRYEALLLATSLSFAAGLIHVIAAVEHMSEFWLFGVFFAVLAAVQLGWGGWVFAHPGSSVLMIGVYLAWAVVILWMCSRTVGLPIGPTPWQPETPGALDVAATSDEIVLALLALTLVGEDGVVSRMLRLARGPAVALLVFTGVALLTGAHHH